jgi:hypothetical protein
MVSPDELAWILCFEESLQVGEWLMRSRRLARFAGRRWFPALLGKETLVFIFVTVGAQQLPVAPIGRVVVVIVVAMVNLQQLQVGVGELAATAPAYPRVDPECLLAVALGALFARTPRLGDDAVEASVIWSGPSFWHGRSPGYCA